ncbi:hypothetical protein JHK86_010186 [Glycine max]|nr:hypothetical protein JHK86_010186 [Glycine max]
MSFAAYKMMQCPTDIDNCATGFLTHSRSHFVLLQPDDIDAEWPSRPRHHVGSLPNLVVTVLEGDQPPKAAADSRRGALLDGIAGASLELVCHYRWSLCRFKMLNNYFEVSTRLGVGQESKSKIRTPSKNHR